jgi:hypothetical protein
MTGRTNDVSDKWHVGQMPGRTNDALYVKDGQMMDKCRGRKNLRLGKCRSDKCRLDKRRLDKSRGTIFSPFM